MTLSSQVSSVSSQTSSVSSQTSAVSSQTSSLSSQVSSQSSQVSSVSSQTSAVSSQAARHETRVSDIDQFIITPGEAAANPGAQGPSAAQRLRIFVPNIKTVLAMGEPSGTGSAGGTRQEDTGEPTFGGFNVGTDGNIFMTAVGSSTLQSQKHVGIHSYGTSEDNGEGEIFVGANHRIGVASKDGNVLINGGGGIVMAGGKVWPFGERTPPQAAYTVDIPAWVSSGLQTTDLIGKFWSAADAACAAYSISQINFEALVDAESSKASRVFGWIGLGTSILNIIGNLAGIAGKEPFGGTVIHGMSGVIIGTGGTMGLYSVLGSGLASATSCQVLAPTVSVSGIVDATLTSKGGTGVYGDDVQIISQAKTLLASKVGATKISGQSIAIGDAADAGKQKASDGVVITAVNAVTIGAGSVTMTAATAAKLTGTEDATVSAKKAKLDGSELVSVVGKGVEIGGTEHVTIGAGEALIKLTASEASIGFGCPPNLDSVLSKIEQQIGENQKEIDKWSKQLTDANSKPRKTKKKLKLEANKHKSKLEGDNKALNTKMKSLKQKANAIKFKDGGIEIIFQGNKMKIDGSKVESGPIKWMK